MGIFIDKQLLKPKGIVQYFSGSKSEIVFEPHGNRVRSKLNKNEWF